MTHNPADRILLKQLKPLLKKWRDDGWNLCADELEGALLDANREAFSDPEFAPNPEVASALREICEYAPAASEPPTTSDGDIFALACKLVDTAGKERKTYWLPILSQLCEAVRKQDREISAIIQPPAAPTPEASGDLLSPPMKTPPLYVPSDFASGDDLETARRLSETLIAMLGAIYDKQGNHAHPGQLASETIAAALAAEFARVRQQARRSGWKDAVEKASEHICVPYSIDLEESPRFCCTGCIWKGDDFGEHIRGLADPGE